MQNKKRTSGGKKQIVQEIDKRLDRMIEIADRLDLSLDQVVVHMGRCDQRTFEALSDNPSRLPRYIKSRVKP
jgi:dsDNA-binding SOS-regulon protein